MSEKIRFSENLDDLAKKMSGKVAGKRGEGFIELEDDEEEQKNKPEHGKTELDEHEEKRRKMIAAILGELKAFGETYKLRNLEGRIQRGLDPAGMMAVEKTRQKLERIGRDLGADIEDVIKLTNELHVGGIWENADKLAEGEDPAIKAWMIAGEVTVRGKEKEGDLTEQEFVDDLERVNTLLDEAVGSPQEFAAQAHDNLVNRSKEQFIVEDEVPVSEFDSGFLAMAVNGYKSGIVKDKGGVALFVGAKELDYSTLESAGLTGKLIKEKRGDREVDSFYYMDKDGNQVVKKLYPGFAIVVNGDMEVAKKLARTAVKTEDKA